ncbi:MAG TPA: glycosyltransferase family 4 protein [Edaphobacter sp.]
MDLARVGLVCEGDASTSETAFSGTAKRMFYSLEDKGHDVFAVDASLQGAQRVVAAVMSASSDRGRWRSKFRYGNEAAKYRTRAAERSLAGCEVDVILQVGASYEPPRAGAIPYAIYSDWNMALDAVEARNAKGVSRGLSVAELEEIGREHARRYKGAAAIFTISERLRQSFIELYGISPERVHTAYAGPNFDMELIERTLQLPKNSTAPTVLFIAKEFRRKGGDLVAAAFARLRQQMPEARLLFAGAANLPKEFEGLGNVEHLGLLDKSDPAQLQRLLQAYRDADVLVLPSRHDPFPTVIREAMFFGLPCVASDIWAMPEMIVDGETGFLISGEDVPALAERLRTLLADAGLRERFGRAARLRAEAMFSWSAVGEVLHAGVQQAWKGTSEA